MFIRQCPQCNKNIDCKTSSYYHESNRSNRLCRFCASRNKAEQKKYKGTLVRICIICGNQHTFKTVRKYNNSIKTRTEYKCKTCATSEAHSNKKISAETRQKMKTAAKNRPPMSEETKKKISKRVSGKGNPMYGVVRHDVRKKYLNFLIENGINPKMFYNPKACEAIDAYGNKHGYNFQHAMNGGEFYIKELGYSVDGYDVDKNVVIEYYEKYHTRPKQIKKDLERQKLITEFLKCEFIILREE